MDLFLRNATKFKFSFFIALEDGADLEDELPKCYQKSGKHYFGCLLCVN